MLTLTGITGLTIIIIEFEVAGLFEVQVNEEVNTHETISLLLSKELEKELPVPLLVPLTYH